MIALIKKGTSDKDGKQKQIYVAGIQRLSEYIGSPCQPLPNIVIP